MEKELQIEIETVQLRIPKSLYRWLEWYAKSRCYRNVEELTARILGDFYAAESQREQQKWKLNVQEQVYISLVEVAAEKKMTIPELIENLIEKSKR
jgi:hypothetical protein